MAGTANVNAGAAGPPTAPNVLAPPATNGAEARATAPPDLPRYLFPLRPLVDIVAGLRLSVHTKLIAGFLVGALLLLGMGVLCVVVIDRMGGRLAEITRLQEKSDRARQMEYLVTAQSHYRTMHLLTQDENNVDKIADSKRTFGEHLAVVEGVSPRDQREFYGRVREANDRFTASSDRVLSLYREGRTDDALAVHLSQEHPISHELEAAMLRLNGDTAKEIWEARNQFSADRGLLTSLVAGFSLASLFSALLLGAVLSWSFMRPLRRIDSTLASIAGGNFAARAHVTNRDEFGPVSKNLNTMAQYLAQLYEQQRSVNATLQARVQEGVRALERASVLKRYLSPQLAESILKGSMNVTLASRRKNLTICFVDARGFNAVAERLQPEELVELLNQYLTAMTDIVFRHGGTLDKYVGETIRVFFGDPVALDDHAERAVRMALEMQARLPDLQQRWGLAEHPLAIGIGITTGYTTVGNVGSNARLDYTVVGSQVTLAGRLAARARAGQILVADRTLAAAQTLVESREIDEVELEGAAQPIRIYEVRARRGA